ncbi:hypothetical protein NL676_003159 [Syzygium grande]|nr:hypothetical protein NL676_003159 [Syzygium grande]
MLGDSGDRVVFAPLEELLPPLLLLLRQNSTNGYIPGRSLLVALTHPNLKAGSTSLESKPRTLVVAQNLRAQARDPCAIAPFPNSHARDPGKCAPFPTV